MKAMILAALVRHLSTAAAAYLAGLGITVVGMPPATMTVVAVGVYIAMQGWSLLHKSGKVAA